MEFKCICENTAKSFKTKDEDAIFVCGTTIDFKKMRDVLKMKASPEKDEALQQVDLGCNMKMMEDEVDFLQNELNVSIERKLFPKCEHNLLARLGISTSDKNYGKLYFSCNVIVPDVSCNFFKWFDECDEPKQPTPSKRKLQEEEEEMKPKLKKVSRKKQKLV